MFVLFSEGFFTLYFTSLHFRLQTKYSVLLLSETDLPLAGSFSFRFRLVSFRSGTATVANMTFTVYGTKVAGVIFRKNDIFSIYFW